MIGVILGPMSTTGSADAGIAGGRDEGPGLWSSFVTALRLIVGWFSVAIATLDLIIEIDRPIGVSDASYLVFHLVWLIGGVVLLALAWIDPRAGRADYAAGGAVTAAGMIIGAIPATTSVCCQSAFSVRHGYPFVFLARPDAGRWHLDGLHAVVDLVFWTFVGLMAVVLVALVRRSPARPTAPAPDDRARDGREPGERQYIEHRGHAEEQADQKTVGPLP
jgi:hypothetical protein